MPASKNPKRRGRRLKQGKPAWPAPETDALLAEWTLPPSAALGSSVRAEGIERELRARLPWTVRKHLSVRAGQVTLQMPRSDEAGFAAASVTVAEAMEGIETLPVLPREAEDILTITAHERQKWLKDGRLRSAGTRTVKLRGRAKAVTFHVFDPRHVEDLLDRDSASAWREEDALAAADRRRRAAAKAALARANKGETTPAEPAPVGEKTPKLRLKGWDDFAADGLLR